MCYRFRASYPKRKHDLQEQTLTPQDRAKKCADLMYAQDATTQGLKMAIEHVDVGTATMSMDVQPHMLNGHGICHGGYIFTLADSAFAFACNTYNQRLIATANETSKTGRSSTYDVVVTGEAGRTVALFHGLSRTIKGHHFPEPTDSNGDI